MRALLERGAVMPCLHFNLGILHLPYLNLGLQSSSSYYYFFGEVEGQEEQAKRYTPIRGYGGVAAGGLRHHYNFLVCRLRNM